MTLTLGLVSVNLGKASGYSESYNLIQTTERSAGGVIHASTWPVKSKKISFSFDKMKQSVKADLFNFYNNNAIGSANQFAILLDSGETINAKFAATMISAKWTGRVVFMLGSVQSDVYEVNFEVEVIS